MLPSAKPRMQAIKPSVAGPTTTSLADPLAAVQSALENPGRRGEASTWRCADALQPSVAPWQIQLSTIQINRYLSFPRISWPHDIHIGHEMSPGPRCEREEVTRAPFCCAIAVDVLGLSYPPDRLLTRYVDPPPSRLPLSALAPSPTGQPPSLLAAVKRKTR